MSASFHVSNWLLLRLDRCATRLKSAFLMSWTSLFRTSEINLTKVRALSGSRSRAFTNAILPVLRSLVSSFETISVICGCIIRPTIKWLSAASIMAWILMMKLQSSSVFCSDSNSLSGIPTVSRIQSASFRCSSCNSSSDRAMSY